MFEALVVTRQREQIVEIILNRPDKRNAMHWPLMEALEAAIDSVEALTGARVVILRGEGKSFSTGLDLTQVMEMSSSFGDNWRQNLFPITAAYQRVVNKFERCSLPVIAALHGHCLGLGFELALACDFRIVAQRTKISLPEARLGLIPDVGGTTRLTRLVGPGRAKEIIMTGQTLDLDAAERWGIANYVVPAEELLPRAEAMAKELILSAPLAVSYTKRVVDGIADIERGLQLEAWAQSVLMRTEDFTLGVQAMLSRREADWQGK